MLGLITAMLIPPVIGAVIYAIDRDRCVWAAGICGVGVDISYLILVYGKVL